MLSLVPPASRCCSSNAGSSHGLLQPRRGRLERRVESRPGRQRVDDQSQIAARALRLGVTSREGKRKSSPAAKLLQKSRRTPSRPIWYRGARDQARLSVIAASSIRSRSLGAPVGSISGARAIASAWSPIWPGKRTRPWQDGAAELRIEAGRGRPPSLRREAGRGGGDEAPAARRRPGTGVAAGCGVTARRSARGIRARYCVANVRIGDRRDMVDQPRLQARALLGRGERLGVAARAARVGRPAASGVSSKRLAAQRAPPARIRSSGSCPAGRVTKPQRAARAEHGAAPAARRASPPSARRHRRRSRGSGRRTAARAGSSCPSVSAVPSGATASLDARPDRARSRPSALRRRSPGSLCAARRAGLVEVEQGAALVEQRRVGRIQIFGLAGAQDAAAEGDARARARRGSGTSAGRGSGHRAPFVLVRRDEQAGLDQLARCRTASSAVFSLPRRRAQSRSRTCAASSRSIPRCSR